MRKSCLLWGAASILAAASISLAVPAFAQTTDDPEVTEEPEVIVVTGTRIENPNVVASSPINSIGIEEIDRKFTPNVERIFRDLPITIPGDNQNVNNGTNGVATIDLRGLDPARTLILIDGKRMVPYDFDGIPDVNTIPLQMLERVDIITGGASAVYGSDAISGAVNFILRKDFEGVELDMQYTTAEEGGWSADENGGSIWDASGLFGTNFSDGRGNVTVGVNYTKREPVLFGDRDFGRFGVSTATGAGLGTSPPRPEPNCQGNTDLSTSFESGVGSTTAIPGTLNLLSGGSYQFRDDGTLGEDLCARFNFNPFNYYQTPQERFAFTSIAHYDINENMQAYMRASFAATNVRFQIAPSGTFGAVFTMPVLNPFFDDDARNLIVGDLTAFAATVANGIPGDPDEFGFATAGIIDNNDNGVFDFEDSFRSTARRRTIELGPRSGEYDNNQFQIVVGLRGDIPGKTFEGWRYDVSYQHGETDAVQTRDGFVNLTNFAVALNTVSATQCETPEGVVTPGCVPLNPFGPAGSISPDAREFGIAIAHEKRNSQQAVVNASVNGPIKELATPWAQNSLSMAFGFEYRDESARSLPDECLKLPPTSCQGGAGGNRLPVSAEYDVREGFVEAIWPIIEGKEFIENVTIEGGYRYAEYDPTGPTNAWKAGASWAPISGLRFRFMEQQAVRAPNIGEIGSPITSGLDNATFDPCSVGNPNPIDAELEALCIATGVQPALVGVVSDIISGQIRTFQGTDPNNLPVPETARTRTVGVVWQSGEMPGGLGGITASVDYYDINVEGFIDQAPAQLGLDRCYVFHIQSACDGIVRVASGLTLDGSGVTTFFENLGFYRATGIEFSANTSYQLGAFGALELTYSGNYFLANEFQTDDIADLVDCKGHYGTKCDPVPTYRHILRTTWAMDKFDLSMLWRYIGSMTVLEDEAGGVFDAFETIDAFHYFDLSASYLVRDNLKLSGLVRNITDRTPPIVGNEVGTTAFNSGNTFPSVYDPIGRAYVIQLTAAF